MTRSLRCVLLGIVLAALPLLAGCEHMPDDGAMSGVTTTVIMVRHADRQGLSDALTDQGRVRAAALPAAVATYDIAAIYSPDRVRNLETVRPLATARGLDIRIVNEWDALDHMLRDRPGRVVMWVGNTDNLMKMYEDLNGTGRPPVGYGDLFVVEVRDGRAVKVTESHFGP